MHYKMRDKLMELSQVVRYHGNIGPMPQNIAAHSWGVAWLITEFHPAPSVVLIKAALEHDLPEHLTSDVSYVSKLTYPPLKEAMDEATLVAEHVMGITSLQELTEEETWWLKWADLMEGAMWCRFLWKDYGFRVYMERWKEYLKALDKHCSGRGVPATFTTTATAEHFTKSIAQ